MTFLETILLIEERGEKIISSDKLSSLQTDQYMYYRISDNQWLERDLTETEKLNKPPTPPHTIPVREKK
jgi:hypothetical protein